MLWKEGLPIKLLILGNKVGSVPWVNPAVIAAEAAEDEIRMWFEMRKTNAALIRETPKSHSQSEQYKHESAKAPTGFWGVENVSDDIIVDGPDQDSHDQWLLAVLKRLERCGLTLMQIWVNSK